jgi:hypothetical protein
LPVARPLPVARLVPVAGDGQTTKKKTRKSNLYSVDN